MSLASSLNPKVIRLVIKKKTVTVYCHLCELEISYYNVTKANGGNKLDPEAGIQIAMVSHNHNFYFFPIY